MKEYLESLIPENSVGSIENEVPETEKLFEEKKSPTSAEEEDEVYSNETSLIRKTSEHKKKEEYIVFTIPQANELTTMVLRKVGFSDDEIKGFPKVILNILRHF